MSAPKPRLAAQHGSPWTTPQLTALIGLIRDGNSTTAIARRMGRTENGINAAAARLIPAEVEVARSKAVGWLQAHLPGTDDAEWIENYRPRSPRLRLAPEPAPSVVADSEPVRVAPYAARHASVASDEAERCDVQDVAYGLALAVDSLDGRPGTVMTRRLGLRGTPASLQVLAETFGLSHGRLRQLQLRGLERLAEAANRANTINASVAGMVQSWVDNDDRAAGLVELVEELFPDSQPHIAHETLLALAGYDCGDRRARLLEVAAFHGQRTGSVADDVASARTRARLDATIETWFAEASWAASAVEASPLPAVASRRVERNDGTGIAGEFTSSKLGRAVEYESLLELTVFADLERSNLVTRYQEQPVALTYTLDGKRYAYHPDVVFEHADGRIVLAEIKPVPHFGYSISRAKSEAGKRFAHERGWGWIQLGPGGAVVDLAAHEVSEPVSVALDEAVQRLGTLRWRDIVDIRSTIPMTSGDIAAYAAKRNLRFTDRPYQLSVTTG